MTTSKSKALIDRSYTNGGKTTKTVGVLVSNLSNHHELCALTFGIKTKNDKYKDDYNVRDMTNLVVDDFLTELNHKSTVLFDNNDKVVNKLYLLIL